MKPNYFIAGNWKMNNTPSEAVVFAQELKNALLDTPATIRIMIAPVSLSIPAVSKILTNTNIELGAQNASYAENGAHTGEISPLMLKETGVTCVIIGHSERRIIYHENNQLINAKVLTNLAHGFTVILCVGETIEERKKKSLWDVIRTQIREGLKNVPADTMNNIVIAYEPVWAIGTGETASPADAEEVHAFIRQEVAQLYSETLAQQLIIQYGGSVKPDNVKELMAQENINGALVGGASLDCASFTKIVKFKE